MQTKSIQKVIKFIMVVSFHTIITNGYSQIATSFAGGNGTEGNPYQISTPQQLRYLSKLIMDNTQGYNDKYYVLKADIDFNSLPANENFIYNWSGSYNSSTYEVAAPGSDTEKESNFLAIGGWSALTTNADRPFKGHFDGKGYKIIGMKIKKPTGNLGRSGLFGYISNAVIKNVTMVDCEVSGNSNIGILVGRFYGGNDTIINCHIRNSVLHGTENVGGLVGWNNSSSSNRSYIKGCSVVDITITSTTSKECIGGLMGYNCYTHIDSCNVVNAKMYFPSSGVNNNVGGFIGKNENYSNVTASFSNNIYINSPRARVGGFIGYNISYCTIRYCYTTNSEITAWYHQIGGFIGKNESRCAIDSCYSTYNNVTTNNEYVGGFIGHTNTYTNITDCFSTYCNVNGGNNGNWCGGLIGWSDDNNVVRRCYATYCNVTGKHDCGGLIGDKGDQNTSHVFECYSIFCNVTGTMYVGGLIGGTNSTATIQDCYSTLCQVSGTGSVGGLCGYVGSQNVQNCYTNNKINLSTLDGGDDNYYGGLIGYQSDPGRVNNCYYRTDWRLGSTSHSQYGEGTRGSAKDTAEMLDEQFVSTLNNGRTGSSAVWVEDTTLYVNGAYPVLSISRDRQGVTYQIWNVDDMRKFSDMIAHGHDSYGKFYTLMADIDFANAPNTNGYTNKHKLNPIGLLTDSINHPFCGNFEGNNYRIYNLNIADTVSKATGLFGYLGGGAYIRDVALVKCDVSGSFFIGSLVGLATPFSAPSAPANVNGSGDINISKCFSTGVIKDNGIFIGGFIGASMADDTINNGANIYIKDCYTKVDILYSNAAVGSFIGHARKTYITNAYSTGSVYTNMFLGIPSTDTAISNTYALNHGGNATAKTKTEMRDTAFVSLLNNGRFGADAVWFADDKPWARNSGYPILGYEPDNKDLVIIEDEQIVTVVTDDEFDNRPAKIIIEDGGSLRNKTTNDFTNVTVERNLLNETYVFTSSAFGDITAGTYLGEDGSLVYNNVENSYPVSMLQFNYGTNMWSGDPGGYTYLGYNSTMKKGWGYLSYVLDPNYQNDPAWLQNNRGRIVKLIANAGTIYNGTFSETFTNGGSEQTHESHVNGLWYALANPYGGNLYASRFLTTNTNTQGNVIYTLDGINNVWNVLQKTDNAARVRIGEGFFAAGLNGVNDRTKTFTWKTEQMDRNTAKAGNGMQQITLSAKTDNVSRPAYISISNDAENAFERNDAYMMFASNQNVVEPYFIVENHDLVINSIKDLPYEAKMGFNSGYDNTALLSFDNIPDDIRVVFIDLDLGQADTVNNETEMEISVSKGSNEGRFVLLLERKSNSLYKPQAETDLNLWTYNDRLTINGKDLQRVEICNILGQSVFTQAISGDAYSTLLNLNAGAYVAKATSASGTKTIKFIINK